MESRERLGVCLVLVHDGAVFLDGRERVVQLLLEDRGLLAEQDLALVEGVRERDLAVEDAEELGPVGHARVELLHGVERGAIVGVDGQRVVEALEGVVALAELLVQQARERQGQGELGVGVGPDGPQRLDEVVVHRRPLVRQTAESLQLCPRFRVGRQLPKHTTHPL